MRNAIRHPASVLAAPALAAVGGVSYGSWAVALVVLVLMLLAWSAGRAAAAADGVTRIGLVALGGLAAALALVQFVPYGHDHFNPPVTAEPAWDAADTRVLAVRACFDCHSNETVWPWYADIAPVSWLTTNHVVAGRETLNFSTWDRAQRETEEIGETIVEGEMPPAYFRLLHSEARLSAAEQQRLIDGLEATIAASPPG